MAVKPRLVSGLPRVKFNLNHHNYAALETLMKAIDIDLMKVRVLRGPITAYNKMITFKQAFTYDHRTLNIELPVRSAVLKQCTGGLVVRWVTTSESPLLYVFFLEILWARRL